jgi:hypothetical protein
LAASGTNRLESLVARERLWLSSGGDETKRKQTVCGGRFPGHLTRDEEVKVGPAAARSPSKFTGVPCLVMNRESSL